MQQLFDSPEIIVIVWAQFSQGRPPYGAMLAGLEAVQGLFLDCRAEEGHVAIGVITLPIVAVRTSSPS